ncbi:hypothetical protein ACOSP7_000826 [Xanthoceras sorbifolium]|uniref:Acid phosphatase/vanadium-dependent haloperoxidase-related protein n=1 Tax=Xanthoceras sorbifolium TaxID=99658 RepID=A0ABQ8INQ6_9ROSI|nr:hypothetical protein JRO89_XS01G0335000 [Xanthoceras sorbifolium]
MDSFTIKPTFISLCMSSINTKTKLPLSPAARFSFSNFTHFNYFKPSSVITFCYRNPSNPKNPRPRHDNQNLHVNPLRVLVPILQSIRGFASSQTQKWVSRLQAYNTDLESVVDPRSSNYLQSGAFGVALLSVTSTAKVKISPFVATLAANPTFVSGFLAWLIAQSTKVFLNFFVERKWDFRIMCSSGGMPSSHSALCTALTTSVALCHGVSDSLFPVCLGFSLIVMYDAIGVRRHAGMQAEVLNMIIADLFQGHPISQRKLKELLGHTPSQVFAGAVLGILVAWICCQGCLVAT